MNDNALAHARWRKSSFSGGGGADVPDCVEVAPLQNGQFAMRNSNHPWITGVKAGEFDDLT